MTARELEVFWLAWAVGCCAFGLWALWKVVIA